MYVVTYIPPTGALRDDHQKKKIILNGHCPLSSDPPPRLNGQGGPFFGRQNDIIARIADQIDFDNENVDFCDENGNSL